MLSWQPGLKFCKAFYYWIMLYHGCFILIMTWYINIILLKLLLFGFKTPENNQFSIFVYSGIVIVVMVTWCMNLQSVLLLDHVIRQLPYSYYIMVCQYLSTEVAINCTKNTLKCQFWFLVFSGMLFVVMATQRAITLVDLLAEKAQSMHDVFVLWVSFFIVIVSFRIFMYDLGLFEWINCPIFAKIIVPVAMVTEKIRNEK